MDNLESKKILYQTLLKLKKTCPRYLKNYTEGERAILSKLMLEYPNGVYPKDLQEFLNVGSGRIGNVLKQLEEKNWINRTTDDRDCRKTVVTLTKDGFSEIEKIKKDCDIFIDKTIEMFGKERFNKFVCDFKDLTEIILICEQEEINNV